MITRKRKKRGGKKRECANPFGKGKEKGAPDRRHQSSRKKLAEGRIGKGK